MMTRERRNLCLWGLLFGLGSAMGQPVHAPNEAPALRGGVPENMPGFYAAPDGRFLVADPIYKKIQSCFEEKLKRRMVWVGIPTARLINMVVANEIDLIYPMQFKPERNAIMQPSEYTARIDLLQVARRKMDLTDTHIRVGVRVNSPEYADMKAAGYSDIAATSDYEALGKMLSANLIDVAVLPSTVFSEMKGVWGTGLVITVRTSREVGFYLNKSDPAKILEQVNRAVKACRVR